MLLLRGDGAGAVASTAHRALARDYWQFVKQPSLPPGFLQHCAGGAHGGEHAPASPASVPPEVLPEVLPDDVPGVAASSSS